MAALHFPLYLCSITETSWWKLSPCSSLTSPQFNGKKSRCENKKQFIFSDILPSSCSYESIRSCKSSLKFAALKFPRKPFETFSKYCHAAFYVSLNIASKYWSLKSCLIWGPINTPAFTFSKVSLGNFPHKYMNAGPYTSKAFTKYFISPNLIYSGGGKTFLGFIKRLCITFFIPGVNDCLWGQCFLEKWVPLARLSLSHRKHEYLV